jgi:hypothetical protein
MSRQPELRRLCPPRIGHLIGALLRPIRIRGQVSASGRTGDAPTRSPRGRSFLHFQLVPLSVRKRLDVTKTAKPCGCEP